MKREICCEECARGWLRTGGIRVESDAVPVSKAFELAMGERLKLVRGTPLRSSLCDGCGARLEPESPAVAVSLFSDTIPYFEWEDEFIRALRETPKGGGPR